MIDMHWTGLLLEGMRLLDEGTLGSELGQNEVQCIALRPKLKINRRGEVKGIPIG